MTCVVGMRYDLRGASMIKPSVSYSLALTLALALACGSEEPDVDPLPEFEETTPGILPAADESTDRKSVV